MSVVVNMPMPVQCASCPMCGTESGGNGMYKLWCMCGDIPASSQRRPNDCPILCQLPEGHGRLVDADMLEDGWIWGHTDRLGECECIERAEFHNAPTIVPAERSETCSD